MKVQAIRRGQSADPGFAERDLFTIKVHPMLKAYRHRQHGVCVRTVKVADDRQLLVIEDLIEHIQGRAPRALVVEELMLAQDQR